MTLQDDVKDAFREIGKMRVVLEHALAGHHDWRAEARKVLGLERQLKCLRAKCANTFPSGGKKKFFCSDVCRDAYDESLDPPKVRMNERS